VTKVYAQFDDVELQEAHYRYSPVDDDWDSCFIASSASVSEEREAEEEVKSG
jgi:hypothetical protein